MRWRMLRDDESAPDWTPPGIATDWNNRCALLASSARAARACCP
jgi:hypothetical protein